MNDIESLIARIRFELDQLSARNAHHDFEHLCRHLARARICVNILPATGPVSAGGDQGRDFETYRSYLGTSLSGTGTFIGLLSTQPLAFACTLQRENVPAKIRSDVVRILHGGTQPAAIHYFCERHVPVGQRHELQAWAREQHGKELEIHDGQALSEMLAAPDVFWIASRYLRLPTDKFPRNNPQDQPRWYEDTLSQWQQENGGIPANYSEFVDIQRAVRHATTEASLSADLPFWITKLERLESAAVSPNLKRRATYEIIVARLRGIGTLLGEESRIRKYLEATDESHGPNDLEDAAIVVNYCAGARARELVGLDESEIKTFRDAVRSRIEHALHAPQTPSSKCTLLQIRGYVNLFSGLSGARSLDQTFDDWMELIRLADDALLFPLQEFADRLT